MEEKYLSLNRKFKQRLQRWTAFNFQRCNM